MDVVSHINEWSREPFNGGQAALRELAAAETSGVVVAGGAWLFLTNGTPIGLDGTQGALERDGTVYHAPTPALPMLAVMQKRSNVVYEEFYTERTPLGEADRKLSSGGFTGYIELSEHVLSGDYYVVYHAGRSTSVAFVGQSGRLLTGQDAFETATGEVGLYQVRAVEIEPLDIEGMMTTGGNASAGGNTKVYSPSGNNYSEIGNTEVYLPSGNQEEAQTGPKKAGNSNDGTTNFCSSCGEELCDLTDPQFCPQCGHRL